MGRRYTMARRERLKQVIALIQQRPRSTEELAELCHVSERTVRRDLAAVQTEPYYAPLCHNAVWSVMEDCPQK